VKEFSDNNIHGSNCNKFVALLEFIKTSSEYRMLFHPHHIMSTARLREGSNALDRKESKSKK
jgi:hypothetical protein